mgnify:CR=1 FL=1
MKNLWTALLMLTTLSAHAFVNEVECNGNLNGSRVDLEVERAWGGMRPARLIDWGQRGTNSEIENFMVRNVRALAGRLQYNGDKGFFLEVDLWPDRVPAWGRTYRASFMTQDRARGNLFCRFPNARP